MRSALLLLSAVSNSSWSARQSAWLASFCRRLITTGLMSGIASEAASCASLAACLGLSDEQAPSVTVSAIAAAVVIHVFMRGRLREVG